MSGLPINIAVEKIHHRPDARPRSEDALTALSESIEAVGLINPIRVRPRGDGYEVVAGSHRLQAIELLGWREVMCLLVEDDDLRAELAMIDENLCRAELSPSERATQTARRKAIYLEMHPETANGSNQHTRVGQVVQPNFAEATAILTGTDARTVRRDAERGEKIFDKAMDLIRGTPLDTGSYLDRIKNLTPAEQMHAVKRDLAWERKQEREKKAGSPKPKKGGIAGRYGQADNRTPTSKGCFALFQNLVDQIEAIPLAELIADAGPKQRSALNVRASSLMHRLAEIVEGRS